MPSKRCLIKSCTNHKGKHIFRVPELDVVRPEVRKKWLELIDPARVLHVFKNSSPYGICQTHFTSDSFQPATKDDKGRLRKTLLLFPNAIPTLDIGNASLKEENVSLKEEKATLKEEDPLDVDHLASIQEPLCLIEYEDQNYFLEEKPKIDELKVEILIKQNQTPEILSLQTGTKQEMDSEKEIEFKNENSFETTNNPDDDGSDSIKDENSLINVEDSSYERIMNESSYKCEYCEKTFLQARNIKRHILVVHQGCKFFKCGDCQHPFGSKQELKRHCHALNHKFDSMVKIKSEEITNMYKSDGTIDPKYSKTSKKCKYCGETFRNLKQHIRIVHKEQDFQCGLENVSKRRVENMYKPLDSTNNSIVESLWDAASFDEFRHFNCPSCPKHYTFLQDFVNHAYETHPESINYLRKIYDESIHNVVPPWTFESELEKPSEMSVKIEVNDEFEIDDSGMLDFPKSKDNDKNNGKKFEDKKRESKKVALYKCGLCGKSFRKLLLRGHIQAFHEGQIKCDFCDKSFSYHVTLKKHIYRKHKLPKTGTTCEMCGKSFLKAESLNRHIRQVHLGQNVCETCGKAFFGIEDMKQHIDSVHLNKPNIEKHKHKPNILGKSKPNILAMDQS